MSVTGPDRVSTDDAPAIRPPVLVWHPRADEYRAALLNRLGSVHVEAWGEATRPSARSQAEVLLTWRLPPRALTRLPHLRWLQAAGAGVDHLIGRDDLPESVTLSRSLGRFGVQAAEYVVGYLLHHLLAVDAYRRDQESARWQPRLRPLLADLTVGVLGLGSLGSTIAERLAGFGAEVIGICRHARPADHVRRVVAADRWRSALPYCQALVLAAPLTPATRGMVDGDALRQLPQGALLINVARGELIDEGALLEALRSGHLGGAVLDAFSQEPLPADDPLWSEPGAWLTPHVAGPSEIESIADEFADNYRRWLAGEALRNVVDRQRGY